MPRSSSSCSTCGAENPPDAKFCAECGASLQAASAEAVVDERKQATVLFADVLGSMEIAEQVSAERLREIMNGLFTRLAAAVTHYEGTVDKFTGDGIMAVFGAPVALEDHALRACLAAVQMREAAGEIAEELERSDGIELELRIGLNSGEIVAGAIGKAGASEYTAVGFTVGLAQRVESIAAPNEIWMTEATSRLVGDVATLDDVGEHEVKGSRNSISLKRLVALHDLDESDGIRRPRKIGLIGRERELAELKAAADAAIAGQGGSVGIVGLPGIGKSRLAQELVDYCDSVGVPVYRSSCQAHTREVARFALLRLLRSAFSIDTEEPAEVSRKKISDRLLSFDEEFSADLPLIFDYLEVPDPELPVPQMDPSARHRKLLGLVDHVAQARNVPVVYLVEDLHWCDPESEIWLNAIVDSTRDTPTLFVGTMRPEFQSEMLSKPNHRQLNVPQLSDDEMMQLASEMIGEDQSVDGLTELIATRCTGVPLFAEEIIYDLADSGALSGSMGSFVLNEAIESVSAPSTVQAVLGARIDRLDSATKGVLTTASAIGDEFRFDVLARASGRPRDVLDAAMRELTGNEFIVETQLFPVATYRFRHPLTHEVAYGSQLADRRASVHRSIATALQGIYADQLNENAALISTHFEAAGDPLSAAHWLARDAARAVMNDPASSFAGWQKVARLSKQSIDTGGGGEDIYLGALTMLLAQAYRFGRSEVDMRPVFEEARPLAEKNGDPAMVARLLSVYGLWLGMGEGRIFEWWSIGAEARKMTADLDVPLVRLASLVSATYCGYVNGKYEDVIAMTDELLELTADDPQFGAPLVGVTPAAWALMIRAPALTELGRCDEARDAIRSAVKIAKKFGGTTVAWARLFEVLCALRGLNPVNEDTLASADCSVAIAEEIGDVFTVPATVACRVGTHAQLGNPEQALEDVHRAARVIDETGAGVQTRPILDVFAMQAYAVAGEADAAIEVGERALEAGQRLGSLFLIVTTLCGLAELRIERNDFGDLPKAEKMLNEADEMLVRLRSRIDEIEIHRVRSKLLEAKGDLADGAREYSAAIEIAREIGATGQLARLGVQVEAE